MEKFIIICTENISFITGLYVICLNSTNDPPSNHPKMARLLFKQMNSFITLFLLDLDFYLIAFDLYIVKD